jgi:hypothetical protein
VTSGDFFFGTAATGSLEICIPTGWPTTSRGLISSKKIPIAPSIPKSGDNTFAPARTSGISYKGYDQFNFHYNRDDASVHYDDNGFLVRPAPVGAVVNGTVHPHNIRAYYLGWTGNGHIGRMNVSNAFYQALGHDDFNTIAGRRVSINAQMAALELSVDKDWVRYRASFFYASGDSSNRSGASRTDSTARGFDSIVDNTHFSGS